VALPARCGEVELGEPHSCVDDSASWGAQYGGGIGVGAYLDAHVELDHFDVSGSKMCGLQLSRGGTAEAREGEVHHNRVGLNVQTEGFGVTKVMNPTVRWYENDRPMDTAELAVPAAIPEMPEF